MESVSELGGSGRDCVDHVDPFQVLAVTLSVRLT
jgi:hypothetical protein